MHITSYVPNIEKEYINKYKPILNTLNNNIHCNNCLEKILL